jgi:hypothetical protein
VFLIYKYSGVAFVEQTFLHFELQSLLVGFTIYPVKYFGVVAGLVILSLLLIKHTPEISLKKSTSFMLMLALFHLLFFGYGTSIGRLLVNYDEFKSSQKLNIMTSEEISPYERFGIQPVISNDYLQVKQSEGAKNLIVIYLESFSRGFVNNVRYPDLTPELNKLIGRHGEFENYHSTAKFTMQGLISSLCGLVPKLSAGNNIGEDQIPYKNLPCLTNILHQAGYQQEFIGGARKSFSNKEVFLKSKQFDEVWGWTDYDKPSDYQTNDWGLQDSDLFQFALERLEHLNQAKQPFHLSMLTLATHLDGNPDPACPSYSSEKQEHKFIEGIYCADNLLGRFLDSLEQRGLLENTAVLITSDHGVFPVDLIKNLFGKNFQRNRLFGVLIDDYQFDKSLPIGLYDIPSILLKVLKIKTNAKFINGRSPENIAHDRQILRENVLSNFEVPLIRQCNQNEPIEPPIDPCENSRLVEVIWRYAASFSTDEPIIDISKPIQLKTQQAGKKKMVEFILDGQEQLSKFLVEGYPLTKGQRKFRNHIFMVKFDLKNNSIERSAFNYTPSHTDYFVKKLNNDESMDSYYFIFTEFSTPTELIPEWEQLFNSLGSKKFKYPEEAYFGIYKKTNNSFRMIEWSSADPGGLNVTFDNINQLKFSVVTD